MFLVYLCNALLLLLVASLWDTRDSLGTLVKILLLMGFFVNGLWVCNGLGLVGHSHWPDSLVALGPNVVALGALAREWPWHGHWLNKALKVSLASMCAVDMVALVSYL